MYKMLNKTHLRSYTKLCLSFFLWKVYGLKLYNASDASDLRKREFLRTKHLSTNLYRNNYRSTIQLIEKISSFYDTALTFSSYITFHMEQFCTTSRLTIEEDTILYYSRWCNFEWTDLLKILLTH